MEDILYFISGFSESRELFKNGYCYWFARILCERFCMKLYYLPINNHFLAYKNGIFYDIDGVYEPKDEVPCLWKNFKKHDTLWCDKIKRDCIRKERL